MKLAIGTTALLAILIVGCTSSDGATTTTVGPDASSTSTSTATSTTTTTSPPDGFGGEAVVGVLSPIATLNPFAPNSADGRLAGNAVWATVYDIDPETWERIPDTVAALPSQAGSIEVNDDGSMTVRYEVRSGAMWSDGTPISGEDIAFTAAAMRDLALTGSPNVDPVMATVIETDAVEQLAFITFEQPTLAFEDALWIILPSHALDGVDLVNGTDGSDWPSGGPFVLDSIEASGDVRFVRNERYWKTDDDGRALPHLDSLVFTPAFDEGASDGEESPNDAVFTQEVDVSEVILGDSDLDQLAEIESNGAVLQTVPTPAIEHLTFQFEGERVEINPLSLNDELSYRTAVAMALDRTALLGESGVPWLPQTPGMLIAGGISAWDVHPYDPAAGADLVQELTGEGNDTPQPEAKLSTTSNDGYRVSIGESLGTSFSSIGVGYEPIFLDSVLFFGDALASGAVDIGMWAWLNDGGYASQLALLEYLDPAAEPPSGNYSRWGTETTANEATERFSEIALEAATVADPEILGALVGEAEAILAAELPLIPLFSRASSAVHWSDAIVGVVHNGTSSEITWNVERWQRVGE